MEQQFTYLEYIIAFSKKIGICLSLIYDRETGLTHDFTHKGGVVHQEILLPDHAPKEYLDRQTLWKSVTKVEKKSNAQFAREVELALPVEFSRELQLAVIKEYVQTNFISKGMCADIAIHDKKNGNPHAHILLTTRPIKTDGSWGTKEKKEYTRDENGNRIPIIDKKTGKQKLGKRNEKLWKRVTVQANDWNDRNNVEKWRKSWADICNRYLPVEQQIDNRSYERQELKTKKLKSTSVETQAFKSIYKKAVIKVPKKQKKAYTKWLRKKGITKKMKIK